MWNSITNSNGDSYSNGNGDSNCNRHSDSNCYGNSDSDSYGNSYANPNANTKGCSNTKTSPDTTASSVTVNESPSSVPRLLLVNQDPHRSWLASASATSASAR